MRLTRAGITALAVAITALAVGVGLLAVLSLGLPNQMKAQGTKGTVELWEGTVRQIYIDKPLVGAKGYLVSNLAEGEARVEMWDLPQRDLGYEIFLFEIDVPQYVSLLFKDAKPNKGLNDPAPPFDQIAPLITQWYSLSTIHVDDGGHGVFVYDTGDDLYGKGLNMIMIFGKQSEGSHEGPEDLGELMVECNGPIPGALGIAPMELRVLEGEITVRPD